MSRAVVLDHSAAPSGAQLNLCAMAEYLGAELHFLLLEEGPVATALRSAGADVRVETLNDEIGSSLITRRDPSTARVVLRAARELRVLLAQVCRATRSRVLVVNSLRAVLLLSLAGIPDNVRVLVFLRDILSSPYMSKPRAVATRAALSRVADVVLANSTATLRSAGARRASVLPPFISGDFFRAPQANQWPAEALRILMLGRIAPWKGQLFALEALAETGHAIQVAGGSWFGESDYHHNLLRRAAELSNVEVLGHRGDVVDLIDANDVVLHSSVMAEPFGQVIVQGMARGRVVVASEAGGPGETISDGYDGLLYRAGDALSLQNAIASLDPACAEALGGAARRTSFAYHPSRTAHRLMHVIDRLEASG